jgi:predicted alpha/beta-fold hydrolase
MVKLSNVDVALPASNPHAGWQANIAALLERYEGAAVLVPGDERLEPSFGGVLTLSYFGADPQRRLADQQIPAGWHAHGSSVDAACAAASDDQSRALETTGLPSFTPIWLPISRSGGRAPESARCDEFGKPLAPDENATLCVFARLALQTTERRPLVVVVHGLFDSGAQDYVQRMAAVLYRQGASVLLPDMRDHGDTLRAAPQIATTFGTLEGRDLLALVQRVRQTCGSHVGRVGIAGVSGGGLDAIRAFTDDHEATLDAGVIALSPLLDVDATVDNMAEAGACALPRTIELSWTDDLGIGAGTGAAAFGGAALASGLRGQRLDVSSAVAGGIGAAVGLLSALAVDAWFDGGSKPCMAQNSIARMVDEALRARWRTLRANAPEQTMSPRGRRIEPDAINLEDYLRERVRFLALRSGVTVRDLDTRALASDLRVALAQPGRADARLFVIGAVDDPITRIGSLREFTERTAGIPQVYVRPVNHGGHGAMWVVQPKVMQQIFARFFGDSGPL